MENAIHIKEVSKSFGDFKLDNISFDLPSGCIMGLIGENGAGKSTTIRLIMNAIKKDSGEIEVLGVNNESEGFNDIKEDIGVVLDEAYFPEVITAGIVNQIMANTYKRWDEDVYFEYLKKFGLPKDKKFKDFSRGMKMKLAIAVALSHNPKLLILDEATSGLDPIVRDEILEIFNDFTREPDHSILISSHIVSDLEKLCDYITFIHRGKVVLNSTKDELLENYGIIRCTKAQYEDIPEDAICGTRMNDYGVECLVDKSRVSSAFTVERVSIEDIILYTVKGARK